MSRNSRQRRKYFLLDSNQTIRQKPKTARNRILNLIAKTVIIRQIMKVLRGSTLFFLFCIFMAGFVVFATVSPFFDLKQIVVVRDNPHINAEAVEKALEDFYGTNLIFLDKAAFTQTLVNTFPEFRAVHITEKWPSSLEVKLTLSPPRFTVLNDFDAGFSVISEDGVILGESANQKLPVIKLMNWGKSLTGGSKLTSKEYLDQIEYLRGVFDNDFKIVIEEVRLFLIAHELHLVSIQDTVFWFDLRLDLEPQMRKLELVADEINLYTGNIEHVDLRIPNQVFWKPKGP